LSEAIEAVLASKKAAQRSQTHIKHLGWSLKKFAAGFPKSSVNEIQQHQIEKWLNGKSTGGPGFSADAKREARSCD
jgi:hypothetical protein